MAARWIGRFALENPRVTLKELGVAAAALDLLPDAPGLAGEMLANLAEAHGLVDIVAAIAEQLHDAAGV